MYFSIGSCLCWPIILSCLFVCVWRFNKVPVFLRRVSGSSMHHSSSSSSMAADEATRGVAVEKLETVKKWGLNTYKVSEVL